MSVITGIAAEQDGTVRICLHDLDESGFIPALCERIEPDVWDFHYRMFPFIRVDDDAYCLNVRTALKTLAYDNEKVFDLFLVDSQEQKKIGIVTSEDKSVVDSNRIEFDTEWGSAICQCYKNGKGGVSLKLKVGSAPDVLAEGLRIDEDYIEFSVFSSYSGHIDFYFGRKTVGNASRKYDLTHPLNAEVKDDKIVISEKVSDILGKLSSGGGETWELYADVCGINFPVRAKNGFSSEMFAVSGAVKGRFAVGNYGTVTITTFENDNRDKPKIKVAVIGSCFSRQIFNSRDFFNSDYKRFYECGLTGYHMSFASMMSAPIAFNRSDLTGAYQSDLDAHGAVHFTKDFIEKFKDYSPDYLIVDNYVNISAALIRVGENGYIDENYYLADTPAFLNLENTKRIRAEGEEHFEVYKKKLAEFKSAISGVIDEERIILVRTQPALYKNDNGKITEWESSQIIRFRRNIWERYDSFFVAQFPRTKVIDMRDDSKYISEKSEYFKFAPSHFGSNYYRDLLNKFNKLALQRLIENH